jgi:hypothetical protein
MIYIFEGERIKINQRDYDRMLKLYPNINLMEELEQLDFELREATNKTWFMTLNAKLNYRNKIAKPKRTNTPHSTRDRTLEQDLNDRDWARQ